jgi:putative hemolysin
MIFYEFIVITLMLVVNGVFAAFEMALASVSHARLVILSNQKKKGAASALHMKERMEASLAVVQLGITLAGAIAAATGGAGVEEFLAPRFQAAFSLSDSVSEVIALIIFVVPLSAFTIVFAELVPKMFAIQNNEKVCLGLAPGMYLLSRLVYPLIAIFERIVKAVMRKGQRFASKAEPIEAEAPLHELNAAVALARMSRLIGAREEKILMSAARFPGRSIKEIIIPADEITVIPMDVPLSEALTRAHLDLHTRFPVSTVEDDPQTIQGYITFKDLVVALKMEAASATVKAIVRSLKRFKDTASIADVLEIMIRDKIHIALIESADGGVLGLVTLEDIMEELVGYVESEFDRLPTHVHQTESGWIMGGGVSMEAVISATGFKMAALTDPTKILAQWCEDALGRSVEKGETVRSGGLCVNIRKIRRHRPYECFVWVEKA